MKTGHVRAKKNEDTEWKYHRKSVRIQSAEPIGYQLLEEEKYVFLPKKTA
jgi:hypothetical protein